LSVVVVAFAAAKPGTATSVMTTASASSGRSRLRVVNLVSLLVIGPFVADLMPKTILAAGKTRAGVANRPPLAGTRTPGE
jgi:hypothetical protein